MRRKLAPVILVAGIRRYHLMSPYLSYHRLGINDLLDPAKTEYNQKKLKRLQVECDHLEPNPIVTLVANSVFRKF